MTTRSTIGILGAGNIGQAVADKAVRHGHEVLIGNSRGPETLQAVVEQLGPKVRAVTADVHADPALLPGSTRHPHLQPRPQNLGPAESTSEIPISDQNPKTSSGHTKPPAPRPDTRAEARGNSGVIS